MLARATYLAWRLALGRLAERLAGVLSDFDVTGPEAPEAPWKARRPPRHRRCRRQTAPRVEATGRQASSARVTNQT